MINHNGQVGAPNSLKEAISKADQLRQQGQWQLALTVYCAILKQKPNVASLHHNAGLCLFGMKNWLASVAAASKALELDPNLWQSKLILIKSLRRLGREKEAVALLDQCGKFEHPDLELEKASLLLHELGDARSAGFVAQRLVDEYERQDATVMAAIAALYDPNEIEPDQVAKNLMALTQAFTASSSKPTRQGLPNSNPKRPRMRVGVISPQFRATPVFFFGIGSLRVLSRSVDLIFFDRSGKSDWATPQFQSIATEWVTSATLEPNALAAQIKSHNLDVLIDMGGWMDVPALRALAAKPAPRMYKWIGGQSASTGLSSFDGFLSDACQSPLDLQYLYAEPIKLLESGYVSYATPAYFPVPRTADPGIVLGVIANPAKVSIAFLSDLTKRLAQWKQEGIEPVLRFIERRYCHPALQDRICQALGGNIDIEFRIPVGHIAYLEEVSRLSAVLDTFPYTGGLTTMEALSLGVPCRTRTGKLFSERHTLAHCHYAGLSSNDYLIDGWIPEQVAGAARASLISPSSPRLDHEGVANAMLQLFEMH